MLMEITIKRVYDPRSPEDGKRILVDRLWPRGISKVGAAIDHWVKEIAPSNELRKWYKHDPAKWAEFRKRYFAELDSVPDAVQALMDIVRSGRVTFLYSSKARKLNNAVALREYLESRIE
jgi:uncharacterized protein YeaO (DUF488 family)